MQTLSLTSSDFAHAREHANEANRCAITARTTGAAAVHHAILCGIELMRLRLDHPQITQGRHTTQCGMSWPDMVQEHVGISDETARRWMSAARTSLEKIGSGAAEYLALPAPDRKEVDGRLEQHVCGKSLKELGRLADGPAPKKPDEEEDDGLPDCPGSKFSVSFRDLDIEWTHANGGARRKFIEYRLKEVLRLIRRIERLNRRPDSPPKPKPKIKNTPAKKGHRK